ncbi:ATP-binding protein [Bacteroidota bacterium]
MQNDVGKLEKITERFSKIGSIPVLQPENIYKVLDNCIIYLKARSSGSINFIQNYNSDAELLVPLNRSLFEWVIENIYKNAIDAMKGEGDIEMNLVENEKNIYIDIKDSGKGISKTKYKTIFRPGYTTKTRGWGLGLSLTKRIVESYHQGKIFVSESELNTGTTIRIVLKK